MRRGKAPRQCQRCQRFTSKAMYLVRGRELCEVCGKQEITEWNQLVNQAEQHEKRPLVTAALALCLVFGLAACSDDNGGEQVNSQGVQKCTVEVNGQVKPCH